MKFAREIRVSLLLPSLALSIALAACPERGHCEEVKVAEPSPEELFQVVTSALDDEDATMREAAAEVIWKFHNRDVLKLLVSALDDKSWGVRLNALNSLGDLGNKAAVPHIGRLMGRERISDCEILNAVVALGHIRAESGIQYLRRARKHPDDHLRRCVADSLAQIGGNEAIRVLRSMLNDQDDLTRVWVAGNLALLRLDEGKQHLDECATELRELRKELVNDIISIASAHKEAEVPGLPLSYALQVYQMKHAKGSWKDIEGQIMDPSNKNRKDMILFYSEIKGQEGKKALLKLLKDDEDTIRVYAAGALLSIGDTNGLRLLQDALDGRLKINNPGWTITYLLEFTHTSLKKPILLEVYRGQDRTARVRAAAQLYQLLVKPNTAGEEKGK